MGVMIANAIREGKRPTVPQYCHPKLRLLIHDCWSSEVSQRPSFMTILARLESIEQEGGMAQQPSRMAQEEQCRIDILPGTHRRHLVEPTCTHASEGSTTPISDLPSLQPRMVLESTSSVIPHHLAWNDVFPIFNQDPHHMRVLIDHLTRHIRDHMGTPHAIVGIVDNDIEPLDHFIDRLENCNIERNAIPSSKFSEQERLHLRNHFRYMQDSRAYSICPVLAQQLNCRFIAVKAQGTFSDGTTSRVLNGDRVFELQTSLIQQNPHVIILDDFLGTGNTMRNCIRLIENAGGEAIGCITVAHMPSLHSANTLASASGNAVPFASLFEV
jgi:hypothetical protein